jgi:hypothetical protein
LGPRSIRRSPGLADLPPEDCRHVSRRLTTLVPQPLHKPINGRRCSWSERYDRIFRNEGVTGSNPVSSTKHPGQGDFGEREGSPIRTVLSSAAPHGIHKIADPEHLSTCEGSTWNGSNHEGCESRGVERLRLVFPDYPSAHIAGYLAGDSAGFGVRWRALCVVESSSPTRRRSSSMEARWTSIFRAPTTSTMTRRQRSTRIMHA